MISLSLLAYNIIKLHRLRSRSHLTYEKGYTLAEHEDIKTPFSFIRTIFMGFNYEPQERRQIITHEASHVRHRHSYERLFMSVIRSVFWFNPFFLIAEKDLEEVQEWEADKDVLDEGWELKTYRTTIFKQLFGYNPDITCGLNHSLTKQRFIMMTHSHSGKGSWIRLAATLPIIVGTFFAFGCGAKQAETPEVTSDLTNEWHGSDMFDMCPPCDASVTKTFGAGRSHTGIDYGLNEGVPVYAAAEGEISSITRDDDNGLMLDYGKLCKINKEIAEEISQTDGLQIAGDISGVARRNIIVIKVNQNGEMLLGSEFTKGSLHDDGLYRKEIDRLKEIIANKNNDTAYPEIQMQDISITDGSTRSFRVSSGIISFQRYISTSYADYAKAMNLIMTAYKELREEVSSEVFDKPLAELTDAEMQVIYRAVPMKVSEMEPKSIRR